MMAETCYLAESTICYPPLYNELRMLTPRPTYTTETVAMAAVSASLEQNAGAILVMSTSGNTARLISKYRPSCPIMTLTRNEVTARQIHLHRGCYPFYYNEPRPSSDEGWQTDVDNRIRHGLKQGLELGIIKKGDTVIAVQGWRSGGNNTSEYTLSLIYNRQEDGLRNGILTDFIHRLHRHNASPQCARERQRLQAPTYIISFASQKSCWRRNRR